MGLTKSEIEPEKIDYEKIIKTLRERSKLNSQKGRSGVNGIEEIAEQIEENLS